MFFLAIEYMALIKFWDNTHQEGINAMFHSWTTFTDSVQPINADHEYVKTHITPLLACEHSYVREFRTIIEVNNKYIFIDSVDGTYLCAESYKVPFALILKSQYDPAPNAYTHALAPVSPFTYPLRKYKMDFIYKNRKLREEIMQNKAFTSSMYWGGTFKGNRKERHKLRHYLVNKAQKAVCQSFDYEEYLHRMATTLVGISVDGRGEFCYRDIELAGIGTPYFRPSFSNATYNLRLPGVHYYSINSGLRHTLDHFIDYFEPDRELRDFTKEEWDMHCEISNNSMKWFDENSSPEGSFKLFCEILEKHNIL
jgi:hypothetical protein